MTLASPSPSGGRLARAAPSAPTDLGHPGTVEDSVRVTWKNWLFRGKLKEETASTGCAATVRVSATARREAGRGAAPRGLRGQGARLLPCRRRLPRAVGTPGRREPAVTSSPGPDARARGMGSPGPCRLRRRVPPAASRSRGGRRSLPSLGWWHVAPTSASVLTDVLVKTAGRCFRARLIQVTSS